MRVVALGDVAKINPRGQTVAKSEKISFVGMAELDAQTATALPRETREFAEVSKGYTIFQDGDVLAAKITPCWENGKVGQALLDHAIGVGSTEFHVLRPSSRLDGRYLLHFLRQPSVRAAGETRMTGSAGQKRVPVAFLQELNVILPPLEEQRRIAAILDHADALRAKRRRVLAHLDTLTQSIFNQTFRDSRCEVTFGSVILNGPTNGIYRPSSDYGTGTPILRIDGFANGAIHARAWKRVRISEAEARKYALATDDIIINRVNALSHLGKSAIVPALGEPSVYESNMMRIRLDQGKVLPIFVITWLQTQAVKEQVLARAKKAINQASINQTDVRSLVMPLPSLHLQRVFEGQAEALTAQYGTVLKARSAEDELFSSLQARAFRGEL